MFSSSEAVEQPKITLIFRGLKPIVSGMFEDVPEKKITHDFPRNLEGMSINELELYITDLQNEIAKVQTDIAAKKASEEAAASVFKS